MIRIELDLGPLEAFPTNALPGFAEALLQRLPGLVEHGCSEGRRGGFVSRMEQGTWLGHVVEHVALELQHATGAEVSRGKTRSVKGRPGVYDVLYAYEEETHGLAAGRAALDLVDSLLPAPLAGIIEAGRLGPPLGPDPVADLTRLAADVLPGPTTRAILREARRRGIPAARIGTGSLLRLGHGVHQRRVQAAVTDLTSEVATEIASDKQLTKDLLSAAGLPVPDGAIVTTADEAVAAARRMGRPVVTKPVDGNHGRGINIGLTGDTQVRWGFDQAREVSTSVLVEEVLPGEDHRILVIDGEIAAVALRQPAAVRGDGHSTIAALIEEVNADPRRGEGHEKVLTRITIDDCCLRYLAHQGLTPSSVPGAGQVVRVRPTANLSTGGTAIDMTDRIHPENALIARRAARIIGLDIAGIDFLSPDITRPVSETGGGIVEVNAGPGFRMHLRPSQGRARNVARPVIDMLFPAGRKGRIPIFAITGTNGKSTTSWMLSHILREAGLVVGQTATDGIRIGGEKIVSGDCAGPRSARLVLAEPTVQAAVLECARGGILREGLSYDRADVAAVLNVTADHLALGGIETVEDLAQVKSVVAEAVAADGWTILNADDPLTAAMRDRAGGRVMWFSMLPRDDWPDFLAEHVLEGHPAVTCEPEPDGRMGEIVLHEHGETRRVMQALDVPATFDGTAQFNVANALAAIGMALAHGVHLAVIRRALAGFRSGGDRTPGRLDMVEADGIRVLVDYAHNPHGLAALGRFLAFQRRDGGRLVGVVGMPGDRRDEDLHDMARTAAGIFDSVILREDRDLRDRRPGEVAGIMAETLAAADCAAEIVLQEEAAVRHALTLARRGDVVAVLADDIARVATCVRDWAATRGRPA